MRIKDHRLAGGVYRESPNQGGAYEAGVLDTIVLHYTAGANAESAIRTLSDTERKVSSHLVVGRDGAVTQLLPFNVVGWHAGVSKWGDRESFNQYSIGIEIDNAGQLEEKDGQYVSWFGRVYPAEEVVRGVHRNQTQPTYWHRYCDEQLQVVEELCALLVAEYDLRHILGHEEIAPGRKIDPGPAFPLDDFRARLLAKPVLAVAAESEALSSAATVKATRLNLRTEPTAAGEKVVGYLKGGTSVEIVEEKGGWCRVRVGLEGWVSKRYLDKT
ncbi:MAG: N-acetylmuramoyl-L-alanine amidase [Planctomycetota bacterium]|jgi:N-acetylmuramoyl-L-alanine amidase